MVNAQVRKKKYVVAKGMPEQTMKVHKTTNEFVFVFVRSICSVCACMRACVACVREYVRVCDLCVCMFI